MLARRRAIRAGKERTIANKASENMKTCEIVHRDNSAQNEIYDGDEVQS